MFYVLILSSNFWFGSLKTEASCTQYAPCVHKCSLSFFRGVKGVNMIIIASFKNSILVSFVSNKDTEKFADFQKSSMEDLQSELGKSSVKYLSFSALWLIKSNDSEKIKRYLATKYPSRQIKFYDKPRQVVKLIGIANLNRVKYFLEEEEKARKAALLISRRFKVAGLTEEDLKRLEKELALKYKAALTSSEKATIKANWVKVKAELLNFAEIV